MKFNKLTLALAFCTLFSCSSCKDDPEPEPVVEENAHTLLIYMIGDNDLSTYGQANLNLIKNGVTFSVNDMNVVVYKDNKDSGEDKPILFQLKRVVDKKTLQTSIDTVMIKEFDTDHNSCDPNVIRDVVNLTFSQFNTPVKGFEIWSHGSSWLADSKVNPTKVATRNYGPDDWSYLEIWDLRTALEQCPHLDYICFDACLSGMAEVACELSNVCDYIYAPVTEIMGAGFPYGSMIKILSGCKQQADVAETLKLCVDDFCVHCGYTDYTITLLETAKVVNLAKAVAKLRNAVPEKLVALEANYSIENTFQRYGRSSKSHRYYFYDLQDYVSYLCQDATKEVENIAAEISRNNIVLYHRESETFIELTLDHCSGLGVSVPEFFSFETPSSCERLMGIYGMTKWGQYLGF